MDSSATLAHLIQVISINALPMIFAITLHEAAHGYAARRFGDNTAWQMGRVSLNPARHIDPIGTLLVPLLTFWVGGMFFGWAKPVPVNFGRLRRPKRDMLWVAAAGPAANLAMACAWALLMKMAGSLPAGQFSEPLALMGEAGIEWNVMLMVLNLLPLPPLDGGRILESLLPPRQAIALARIEPYGFIILLVLMMTNILGAIMLPMVNATLHLLGVIFSI